MDSFFCPNLTLFSQQYFVCDWYYNVDCSSAPNYYSLNQALYNTQDASGTPYTNIQGDISRALLLPGNGQADLLEGASEVRRTLSNLVSQLDRQRAEIVKEGGPDYSGALEKSRQGKFLPLLRGNYADSAPTFIQNLVETSTLEKVVKVDQSDIAASQVNYDDTADPEPTAGQSYSKNIEDTSTLEKVATVAQSDISASQLNYDGESYDDTADPEPTAGLSYTKTLDKAATSAITKSDITSSQPSYSVDNYDGIADPEPVAGQSDVDLLGYSQSDDLGSDPEPSPGDDSVLDLENLIYQPDPYFSADLSSISGSSLGSSTQLGSYSAAIDSYSNEGTASIPATAAVASGYDSADPEPSAYYDYYDSADPEPSASSTSLDDSSADPEPGTGYYLTSGDDAAPGADPELSP